MRSLLLRASCLAITVLAPSLAVPATAPVNNAAAVNAELPRLDVAREDVQHFVNAMVRRHRFNRTRLTALLGEAQSQPGIIELMQKPAERTLVWWEYRARFLTEERIAGGAALWLAHRETLERIAAQSGVPAQYLVAITGVETFYGRVTGRHRVLDALVTLAFDYPPRSDYFRRELEQFLRMTRAEEIDPRLPLGSYAGAMGIAQFMPSSFQRFAVDGSGDGRRNLTEHGADVFASVANYFREHGWRAGQPVLAEASIDVPPALAAPELALNTTVDALRTQGFRFDTTLPDKARAVLVPAALEQGMAWRIGFQNFHVITRYNRSALYAMAVNDLAEAIAQRVQATSRATGAS
jgi:membrane-bound lytic murein transglycosylase B